MDTTLARTLQVAGLYEVNKSVWAHRMKWLSNISIAIPLYIIFYKKDWLRSGNQNQELFTKVWMSRYDEIDFTSAILRFIIEIYSDIITGITE